MTASRYRLNILFFMALMVLIGACATVRDTSARAEPNPDGRLVRILVIEGADDIRLRGAKALGGAVSVVSTSKGRVDIKGRELKLPLRFHPTGTFIYVNDRPFRGVVEVRDDAKGLLIINELPLERYIVGIINNEISSKWPVNAIKAQVVAARTYALYQIEKRKADIYHLKATYMDQVYTGAGKEDYVSARAVIATRGEVLYYGKRPALTLYHSSAGGVTEASKDVWGNAYPYLRSVKSRFDKGAPNYKWTYTVSKESFTKALKKKGYGDLGSVKGVKVSLKSRTGRVKGITINGKRGSKDITGESMRAMLGYGKLKSTLFKVRNKRNEIVFTGRGSGHGVGMSQWGAKGMADSGASYKKILKHYYKGTKLKLAY